VAVVLSGAGARGAFQAGALAELVPALHARGEMPSIWLGTSAGSVNAVLWAAALHRGPEAAAQDVLARWLDTSDDDVFRPIPLTAPWAALQYTTGFVLGVGRGTTSLLDTAPLRRRTEATFPGEQLQANVRDGVVAAVGAVATRMPTDAESAVGSGRSVLFLDEHEPSCYAGDASRALDVSRGPVLAEHVLASSAIPVAFPPVRVQAPATAAGWYLDGGVRLNTPLHPAVHLGAERVVVVSATGTSFGPPPEPDPDSRTRDVADAAAQVLTAVLADHTIEDLLTLQRLNRIVSYTQEHGLALPRAGTGVYRLVQTLVVSPRPGEMGRLAARVHAERTGGLSGLREVDNRLLGRFIRGAGDGVGRRELLSYLFFDPEYFARSIDLGRAHARAALQQGWQE
jgi:NTE family protein